jgi:hypothetical protein
VIGISEDGKRQFKTTLPINNPNEILVKNNDVFITSWESPLKLVKLNL